MGNPKRVRKLKKSDFSYTIVPKNDLNIGKYSLMSILQSSGKIHEKLIDSHWVVHRLDGPAIEFTSGRDLYYIEGICHSESEFLAKTSKLGKILYG